ncbi:MAG: response regulator [Bdellovibrionota bacterium]|nr:response regulator [Bdellovibrionota bacterium]
MEDQFIIEAGELLDELEKSFLDILNNKSEEFVHTSSTNIFRVFHNLKGASSFYPYKRLTNDIHKIEDFLSTFKFTDLSSRDRESVISYLFDISDKIRSIINGEEEESVKITHVKALDEIIKPHVNSGESIKQEHCDFIVVDDDVDLLRLYETLFSKLNYKFKCFSDPVEALNFCKKNPPRVILADVLMPKIDGHLFFEALKNLKINSVFVFITGLDSVEVFQQLDDAGAFAVLPKPVSRHFLIFTLKRALKYSKEKNITNKSMRCLMSHYDSLQKFYETTNQNFLLEELNKEMKEIIESSSF